MCPHCHVWILLLNSRLQAREVLARQVHEVKVLRAYGNNNIRCHLLQAEVYQPAWANDSADARLKSRSGSPVLTHSKGVPDAYEGTNTSDNGDLTLELARAWSRFKVRLNPGEARRGVLVMFLW